MAPSGAPDADDTAYLAALLREADRPRYYAALFAPQPLRADLLAIGGFAAEIARVPDQVSDPTLGRIRLQWWRDTLEEAADSPPVPALRGLARALRGGIARAPAAAMIEARDADLYADPPASIAELEAYLADTEGTVFALGLAADNISGADADAAARHGGIAYGLARRLSRLAGDHARGRTILPADMLAAADVDVAALFTAPDRAGMRRVTEALAKLSHDHLARARRLPPRLRRHPAMLPLALAAPLLSRVPAGERPNPDAGMSDLGTLLRIARQRLTGGF